MFDTTLDRWTDLIKSQRNRAIPWDRINYLASENELPNDKTLESHIGFLSSAQGWPMITCAEWHTLVEERKAAEESGASTDDGGLYVDLVPNNETLLETYLQGPESCWNQYKQKLRDEKHFSWDTIERLEEECKWIVNRLRLNTKDSETSIKGLVVGNVQSGKTANMAGVISMAADIGFNFFVILAGRVTNLRTQTTNRLIDDVKTNPEAGGLDWLPFVDMLRPNIRHKKLEDYYWAETFGGVRNRHRYLTVCLKEPNWLKNLIKWLQADAQSTWFNTGQVKMLIIDDECDQASINTQDVLGDLQTTIFRYILGLCNHSMTATHGTLKEGHPYAAVNYLGYTATPYANLLNDADPKKSLYPRDFIKPLKVSPSYWGPSQIFGTFERGQDSEFQNRPFLCKIEDEEMERIREIHNGTSHDAPEALKSSIKWFICVSAIRRLSGTKSPVSMLVHTSNAVQNHANVAKAISNYLDELRGRLATQSGQESVLAEFSELYDAQRAQLSLDVFNDLYIEYEPKDGTVVNDYPDFNELCSFIIAILSKKPTQIEIAQDETGERAYKFSEAIHLCIDNSNPDANKIVNTEDNTGRLMTMRIHYPTKDDPPPSCAPLFIVVGGNTLARGLTLEGLVSSYFLRTVRTGDSLMQMGRWFGYRFGYELLPRIWMTKDCVAKFAFLTQADIDLRQRLEEAVALGKRPEEFEPCMIDTSETISGFTVTSRNKSQMQEVAESDYSCQTKMPYWFSTDNAALLANANAANEVLEADGVWSPSSNATSGHYVYNEQVQYKVIRRFLGNYRFCPKTRDFSDRKALLDYLDTRLADRNWTVVTSGKEIDGHFEILARNYSNQKERQCPPDTIAFRHVTEPSDFIADIDPKLDFSTNHVPKSTQAKAYRCAANLRSKDKTPLLVLTRFSAANINAINNGLFNLEHDIFGFALFLPAVDHGETRAYTRLRCANLVEHEEEPESEV